MCFESSSNNNICPSINLNSQTCPLSIPSFGSIYSILVDENNNVVKYYLNFNTSNETISLSNIPSSYTILDLSNNDFILTFNSDSKRYNIGTTNNTPPQFKVLGLGNGIFNYNCGIISFVDTQNQIWKLAIDISSNISSMNYIFLKDVPNTNPESLCENSFMWYFE